MASVWSVSRSIIHASIVSIWWATGAFAKPRQFDLDCRGAFRDDQKPVSMLYAIDLDQRVYCDQHDGCKTLIDIAGNTPARLILRNIHSAEIDFDFTVNRLDGSYHFDYTDKASLPGHPFTIASDGTCTLAPFSGLPEPKF